jgi:hypothetical protein
MKAAIEPTFSHLRCEADGPAASDVEVAVALTHQR